MIYITGDTHGDRLRFRDNNMHDQNFTKEDVLIVCGDFGYVFRNDQREKDYLDFLAKKPYTICFCDGNHENFDALFSYKEQQWCGGRVHKIRDNIYHLMRGQVFEICGKKIFTMGGAYSIDRAVTPFWNEEIPNAQEYLEARRNLEKHNHNVDVVISHTAPAQIVSRMGYTPDIHDKDLTWFLDWVMYEVNFDAWYFGHWHEDKVIDNLWSFDKTADLEKLNGKLFAVYEKIHPLKLSRKITGAGPF